MLPRSVRDREYHVLRVKPHGKQCSSREMLIIYLNRNKTYPSRYFAKREKENIKMLLQKFFIFLVVLANFAPNNCVIAMEKIADPSETIHKPLG